jgi:hypothetical protein
MDAAIKPFERVAGLGKLLDIFPLRHRFIGRWGYLFAGLVCLLGGATVLIYALAEAYRRYYQFGPAAVHPYLWIYLAAGSSLILAGMFFELSAYLNWPKAIALFEGGFTILDRSGLRSWRWEEITSVYASVTRGMHRNAATGARHRYTLVDRNGKQIVLDDTWKRVDALAANVRERVAPRLYLHTADAFNRGETLRFGPLLMSKEGGIQLGKKAHHWKDILEVAVKDGFVVITPGGERKGHKRERVPVSTVPNLDVLVSLLNQLVPVKIG